MPAGSPIILDINALVNAVIGDPSSFISWPALPPKTNNPAADCVGIVNDCREFSLWLSPHICDNTVRVLAAFGWSEDLCRGYLSVLTQIAAQSGGGVVLPERTVNDCPDFEDNLILDLAAEVGAMLIVSDDSDMTDMSPWRATPILRSADFASRVDATRRVRRRLPG